MNLKTMVIVLFSWPSIMYCPCFQEIGEDLLLCICCNTLLREKIIQQQARRYYESELQRTIKIIKNHLDNAQECTHPLAEITKADQKLLKALNLFWKEAYDYFSYQRQTYYANCLSELKRKIQIIQAKKTLCDIPKSKTEQKIRYRESAHSAP